jgi:magnesium transporter
MNFHDIPLLDEPHGYLFALGLMFALTAGLYVWFKKRDWL